MSYNKLSNIETKKKQAGAKPYNEGNESKRFHTWVDKVVDFLPQC